MHFWLFTYCIWSLLSLLQLIVFMDRLWQIGKIPCISNKLYFIQAVKLVAAGTSMKRKAIYSLALEKFGKRLETDFNED